MAQNTFFTRSFDAVKSKNSNGYDLANWNLKVNNQLNIVKNDPQIISIVKPYCGGLFECTNCRHKWTKKSHSTILFQYNKVQKTIECILFGHNCFECDNNPIYHIANYDRQEIEDTIEFLRNRHREFHRQRGPRQRYYNVDFADYCESCRSGDYCQLHRRYFYN